MKRMKAKNDDLAASDWKVVQTTKKKKQQHKLIGHKTPLHSQRRRGEWLASVIHE